MPQTRKICPYKESGMLVAYLWSTAESNTNVSWGRPYYSGSEGDQRDLKLRDTLKVSVRYDDSEAAFQSGSGNQSVDLTDKARAVRRA
jgi:hypothetical protein